MVLEEHNWTIVHRAGKENANEDALSRIPHVQGPTDVGEDSGSITTGDGCSAVGFLTTPDWSTEKLRLSQPNGEVIAQVLEVIDGPRPAFKGKWRRNPKFRQIWRIWHQLTGEDGVLMRRVQASPVVGGKSVLVVVVFAAQVSHVLEQLHNNSGHMDLEKTLIGSSEDENMVARVYQRCGRVNYSVLCLCEEEESST